LSDHRTALPTLYLLRHAKSSWDEPGLADFDRPLSRRGRRNAAVLATHLSEKAIEAELVLCSPARRARETAEALGLEAHFEAGLYGASSDELARRLAALPGSVDSAMLVGHNPGLEELGRALGAEGRMRTGELWTFALDGWVSDESRLVERFLPR
jgi:phosphohistidine phosphatase